MFSPERSQNILRMSARLLAVPEAMAVTKIQIARIGVSDDMELTTNF
jgi:hypothetical protein